MFMNLHRSQQVLGFIFSRRCIIYTHALRSEEQTPLIRPRPSPNTRRQFLMGTQPEQNQRERSLNIKRMNHRHINTELTSVFGQKHY